MRYDQDVYKRQVPPPWAHPVRQAVPINIPLIHAAILRPNFIFFIMGTILALAITKVKPGTGPGCVLRSVRGILPADSNPFATT